MAFDLALSQDRVRRVGSILDVTDFWGVTAAALAQYLGYSPTVNALLTAGASPSALSVPWGFDRAMQALSHGLSQAEMRVREQAAKEGVTDATELSRRLNAEKQVVFFTVRHAVQKLQRWPLIHEAVMRLNQDDVTDIHLHLALERQLEWADKAQILGRVGCFYAAMNVIL